jgi:osmoprotectant transport system permease protein
MTWVAANFDLIIERCVQHLGLTIPPIILSFLLSVPLGRMAQRLPHGRDALLTIVGLLYAIPSLPLFIALPAILGTDLRDSTNVVAALTIYGAALMVQSATGAFRAVDQDVVAAATGIGFGSWTRFWKVELPLAGPALIAGLRVVAVSTVSLATVGAVLGVKSLGLLFTDGIQRDIPEEIMAGMAATILIAVVIDAAVVIVGRVLLPWARSDVMESASVNSTSLRAALQ